MISMSAGCFIRRRCGSRASRPMGAQGAEADREMPERTAELVEVRAAVAQAAESVVAQAAESVEVRAAESVEVRAAESAEVQAVEPAA